MNKNAAGQQTDTNKKEEDEDEEEDEEEEEILPGSTLFIKNLNYSTTEESLQEVGSEFREPRLRVRLRGAHVVEGSGVRNFSGNSGWTHEEIIVLSQCIRIRVIFL